MDDLWRDWELTLGEPFPSGETSRVLAVTRVDGSAAVLKLSPDPDLIAAEAGALDAWAHTGVVPRVLERAPDALLLERIVPGERLRDRAQAPPVDRLAATIRALHVAPPPGVPALIDRLRLVYGLTARRGGDAGLVARGLAAAEALARSWNGPDVLVHGDLHAGNVLDGGDRLVVIDPRPCVGDPAFDLVDWVLYDGDPRERVEELAAAAGYDAERLLAWTRATAILAGPLVLGRPGGEDRRAAFLPAP